MLPVLPWQGRRDSNPQHAVLETAALPLELLPYCDGNPGRVPKPSRALAPPGSARLRLRDRDANPGRVPIPSRALAPPGLARLRLRDRDANPGRVPIPSRALAPPGSARLRLRDRDANPGRVPIPSRALAPPGSARLRLRDRDANPGRVPIPSRALAPPGSARLRLRDRDGNPGRVPIPSRALAPPGSARLRLRDRWEPRLCTRGDEMRRSPSLRLLVLRVLAAPAAILRQLELLGVRALVLRAGVVALATNLTLQGNDNSRGSSHGILLVLLPSFSVTQ